MEGVSTAKIVLFHQGSTELRRCENCIFFLPVNILTGVTRRLLGLHDTLLCVLMLLMLLNPLAPKANILALVLKKNEIYFTKIHVLTYKFGLLLLHVGTTYSFVVCVKLLTKDRSTTSYNFY